MASFRDGDDIQMFLDYGGVTKENPFPSNQFFKWLVGTNVHMLCIIWRLHRGSKVTKPENKLFPLRRWLALILSSFVRLLQWTLLSTFAKYYRLKSHGRSSIRLWQESVDVGWLFWQGIGVLHP